MGAHQHAYSQCRCFTWSSPFPVPAWWIWIPLVLLMLIAAASPALAAGESVVSLGEDLTPDQQEQVLSVLKPPAEARIITISNREERELLGAYFDDSTIGTRAISSVLVIPGEPGDGIQVTTDRITVVTPAMLENALATAGIRDAVVRVTAPFPVSGTAALAGLIKAYETSAGAALEGVRKEAASQEVAQTIRLAEKLGDADLAAAFLTRLKEKLAEHPSDSPESIRRLIEEVSREFNLQLDEATIQELVALVQKLKAAGIDWNQVREQLNRARQDVERFLGQDMPILRSWLARIFDFLQQLLDLIQGWLG